jgi:hypothetical protein
LLGTASRALIGLLFFALRLRAIGRGMGLSRKVCGGQSS